MESIFSAANGFNLHSTIVASRVHLRRDRADDGIRTRDLLITNQLLYQLSYVGGSVENSR